MASNIKKFRSLNHVEMVAEELIRRDWELSRGVFNVDWEGYTFKWDKAKRRFGGCTSSSNKSKRVISLSKQLTEKNLNNGEQVLDVILHEIAHALTYLVYGSRHGHDMYWKNTCRQIGANPERYYDDEKVEAVEGKYTLECKCCGKRYQMYKKPKVVRSCGVCHPKRFDSKYILTVIKN